MLIRRILSLIVVAGACVLSSVAQAGTPNPDDHGLIEAVVKKGRITNWRSFQDIKRTWDFLKADTRGEDGYKLHRQTDKRYNDVLIRDPNLPWVRDLTEEAETGKENHVIWMSSRDTADGYRSYAVIRGRYSPPGGGGGPSGPGPVPPTLPPPWYTNALDLDLDADSDNQGGLTGTVAEDQKEELSPGATVLVSQTKWSELVLRRVMPPNRPTGEVRIERSGYGSVDVKRQDGANWVSIFRDAQAQRSANLWKYVKDGDLTLRAYGLRAGETWLTANYWHEGDEKVPEYLQFTDKVRFSVVNDVVGLQIVPAMDVLYVGQTVRFWAYYIPTAGANPIKVPGNWTIVQSKPFVHKSASAPDERWMDILGKSVSPLDGVEIKAEYTPLGGNKVTASEKFTVVNMDLVAYRSHPQAAAIDKDDEDSPGAFVGMNADDDNRNNIRDVEETANKVIPGDNDLVMLEVKYEAPPELGSKFRLAIERRSGSSARIRLWRAATAPGERLVLELTNSQRVETEVENPTSGTIRLWVEGVELSTPREDLVVVVAPPGHGYGAADSITYTVVGIDAAKSREKHDTRMFFVPLVRNDFELDAIQRAEDRYAYLRENRADMAFSLHTFQPDAGTHSGAKIDSYEANGSTRVDREYGDFSELDVQRKDRTDHYAGWQHNLSADAKYLFGFATDSDSLKGTEDTIKAVPGGWLYLHTTEAREMQHIHEPGFRLQVLGSDLQLRPQPTDPEVLELRLLANTDDDDRDGRPDNHDDRITGTDGQRANDRKDMAVLKIPAMLPAVSVRPKGSITLSQESGSGRLRLFLKGNDNRPFWVSGPGSQPHLLGDLNQDLDLSVEGWQRGDVVLRLEYKSDDGLLLWYHRVRITVADSIPLYKPTPCIVIPQVTDNNMRADSHPLPAAQVMLRDPLAHVSKLEVSVDNGPWTELSLTDEAHADSQPYNSHLAQDFPLTGLDALRRSPPGSRKTWLFRVTNAAGARSYEQFAAEVVADGRGGRSLRALNLGPTALPPVAPISGKHFFRLKSFAAGSVTISHKYYSKKYPTGTLQLVPEDLHQSILVIDQATASSSKSDFLSHVRVDSSFRITATYSGGNTDVYDVHDLRTLAPDNKPVDEYLPVFKPVPSIHIPDLPSIVPDDTARLSPCRARDALAHVERVELRVNQGAWQRLSTSDVTHTTIGDAYESTFVHTITGLDNFRRTGAHGAIRTFTFRATNAVGATRIERLVLRVELNNADHGARILRAYNLGETQLRPVSIPEAYKVKLDTRGRTGPSGAEAEAILSRPYFSKAHPTGTTHLAGSGLSGWLVLIDGANYQSTKTDILPHVRLGFNNVGAATLEARYGAADTSVIGVRTQFTNHAGNALGEHFPVFQPVPAIHIPDVGGATGIVANNQLVLRAANCEVQDAFGYVARVEASTDGGAWSNVALTHLDHVNPGDPYRSRFASDFAIRNLDNLRSRELGTRHTVVFRVTNAAGYTSTERLVLEVVHVGANAALRAHNYAPTALAAVATPNAYRFRLRSNITSVKALLGANVNRTIFGGGAGIGQLTAADFNRDLVAIEGDSFATAGREEYVPHVRLSFPHTTNLTAQTLTMTILRAETKLVGARPDMRVYKKSDASTLTEQEEMNPGAFVAVNNDDDDVDSHFTRETVPAGLNPAGRANLRGHLTTPDSADADGVVGNAPGSTQLGTSLEDDLVRVRLLPSAFAEVGQNYVLNFDHRKVIVWTTPGKRRGTDLANGQAIPAHTVTDLYVEGIGDSVEPGDVTISARYTHDGLNAFDESAWTVYRIRGPLDVPESTAYDYSIDIPGGTGTWQSAVTHGTGTVAGNRIGVTWDSGSAVGRITALPHANFPQARMINVVRVSVLQPATGNTFVNGILSVNGTGVQTTWPCGAFARIQMNGPARGGHPTAGVKGLQVGYIQWIENRVATARYTATGFDTSVTSHMQGRTYVDQIGDFGRGFDNNLFWYNAGAVSALAELAGGAANQAPPHTNYPVGTGAPTIDFWDPPGRGIPASVPNPGGANVNATAHDTNYRFQLRIAVRTLHDDTLAPYRYFPRARPTPVATEGNASWTFIAEAQFGMPPNPPAGTLAQWYLQAPAAGSFNTRPYGFATGVLWQVLGANEARVPISQVSFGLRTPNELLRGGLRGFSTTNVSAGNLQLPGLPLAIREQNTNFADRLIARGGAATAANPLTWTDSTGYLGNHGMNLAPVANQARAIDLSGAANAPETGVVELVVRDNSNRQTSNRCEILTLPRPAGVASWGPPTPPPGLALQTTLLPWGRLGAGYNTTGARIGWTGGVDGYNESRGGVGAPNRQRTIARVIAGRLPRGVNLRPNGTLTGLCLESGVFRFTVEVRDQSRIQRVVRPPRDYVLVIER
jgi:hypothetical protein